MALHLNWHANCGVYNAEAVAAAFNNPPETDEESNGLHD